jgi:hypothetical protein
MVLGVCAGPPSLYLSAIWSAHGVSADLVASASMPGFAHEDRAGQDAAVTAFRTPLHPASGEWLYARSVSDHSHRSESLFTALALVS